jgi:hypothetical protein
VPSTWERSDVLDTLRKNENFCTITEVTANKWHHGAKVKIIRLNGVDYIKTVKDSITKDNLGELPTF